LKIEELVDSRTKGDINRLATAAAPAHNLRLDTIPATRAERELLDLIHRATAGETIVIEAPSGERVRLEPLTQASKGPAQDRKPGRLKGKLTVPARLMEPMPEDELNDWYGKPD